MIASGAAAPTETLSGLVERVTYHNPDNGFCVLGVKARGQRDLVAVVGHAAAISAGEFISATGLWITERLRRLSAGRPPWLVIDSARAIP